MHTAYPRFLLSRLPFLNGKPGEFFFEYRRKLNENQACHAGWGQVDNLYPDVLQRGEKLEGKIKFSGRGNYTRFYLRASLKID
jgi:hypothetical protein